MDKLAIYGGEPVRKKPFPSGKKVGFDELRELMDVIESGNMYRYPGAKVPKLEEEFARLYGTKHAIASTSGTASIHVAVGMLNPNPGGEIITAPITDLGTVVPILYQNAIPIFADVDYETFNMDPADVERRITEKTKAILVVHLFGTGADMDAILDIARRHKLMVIEDCSQAHVTEFKGRLLGTIGDIGCFSLQQSKHMTTGDGGMTITNNDDLAERGKFFQDKGWRRAAWGPRAYLFLAPNYRMNELSAAVGLAQCRKVKDVVAKRAKLGDLLTSLLKDAPGVHPQKVLPGAKHSYWSYGMTVDERLGSPDEFAQAVRAEGVSAGAHYIGLPIFLCAEALSQKKTYGASECPFSCPHARPGIEYTPGQCPVCERVLNRMITTGISEFWSEDDIRDMGKAFVKVAKALWKA
ncbi:MAG: DegT/DnrJ/EryC1/StrS family aminotransferase [Planctomycetes bacterium]|nr:DegT/DnrJ/EryC1/StrS family aminotransferase [Planctomycetota bacterium]